MAHYQKIMKVIPKLLILGIYIFSATAAYYQPDSVKSCNCLKHTGSKCGCCSTETKCKNSAEKHSSHHIKKMNSCGISSCSCGKSLNHKQDEAAVTPSFQLPKVNPEIIAVIQDNLQIFEKIMVASTASELNSSQNSDEPLFIKDLALII